MATWDRSGEKSVGRKLTRAMQVPPLLAPDSIWRKIVQERHPRRRHGRQGSVQAWERAYPIVALVPTPEGVSAVHQLAEREGTHSLLPLMVICAAG
jgi:hypothetical protein